MLCHVDDPDEEGENSDLYCFQGQKWRSVPFFEVEEAKKRGVIDPAFACLMAVLAIADE